MKRLVIGVLCGLLTWTPYAAAQFAVEDVYVGVQTAITAINSARAVIQEGVQIANQAEMIKNQIEMLAYAAANLTKSPLQILGNLDALIGRYETILRQAQGIGYQLDTIAGQFDGLFGMFGQPVVDVSAALGELSLLTREIGRASLTAMRAQAIQDRLAAQRAHLQVTLTASDASAGQLAAIQNTNQVLGVMVEQQVNMQQIYAASARLQTTMAMAQAAASERARQVAAQMTQGWGSMEDVKGVGIPEFR